jgi:hypothetical protein
VKLRGFRIEPGEIEAALGALPGVAQAAVLLREDRPGDKRLVAYVCGQDMDADALRAQLAQVCRRTCCRRPLSRSMRCHGPPTESSTAPHCRHPRRSYAGSAMYSDDRLPRDIVERHLLGIWESMFERSDIAVDQDFFAIGGHSLLAVRLVDAIARTFGTRLPLDTFWFRGGTIRDIAAVLRESGGVHWPLRVAIKARWRQAAAFLLAHDRRQPVPLFRSGTRAGSGAAGIRPECARCGWPGKRRAAASATSLPTASRRCVKFSRSAPTGWPAFPAAAWWRSKWRSSCAPPAKASSVLALIDTYAPGVHLRVHGRRTAGTSWAAGCSPYMNRQRLMHALLNTIGRTPRRGFPDAASAHWWAHWSYRPRHYPGRVDLYVAEESRREASRPCLGWSDVVPALDIHPVAGSHGLMVKQPVVQDLARQLQLRLDEAMPVRDEGGAP